MSGGFNYINPYYLTAERGGKAHHDLDQYKLEAIVFLRDEKGNEHANPAVESPSGSDHHRSGVVRFKGVDISSATAIDLIIKDMAGAKEMVFRFDIK